MKGRKKTMKKAYLLIIDETGKHVRKLVICEKCVYFRSADLSADIREGRHKHICRHPDGMINPMTDFLCPLGKEGSGDE